MEKLDVKKIFSLWEHKGTIEEINEFNRKFPSERVKISFKEGLEYAENHYLKLIEEKEQLLNQYREDYIRLCKEKATIGII